MLKREVVLTELKPEFVEEYRSYHDAVWPELEGLYREAGYYEMSCFLNGSRLIIYMVYDEDRLLQRQNWLNTHHVQQKWQSIMQKFKSKTVGPFDEVYRLPSLVEKEQSALEPACR